MARETKQFDAIVIGAGLHGSSAALHLAREKFSVLLLDQGSGGRNSSKVSAGGLRRLRRAVEEIPLAVEALEMWHDIESLVDDPCGTVFDGQVCVAEDADGLRLLQERAALLRSMGYQHEEIIDAQELRSLVPTIAEHCVGGMVSRLDGFGSPFRSTLAFQRKAESLGVQLRRRTGVTECKPCGENWQVQTNTGHCFEAPVVINCAGAWGDQIAAMIGEEIPIIAQAPMMMVTAPVEMFLKPVIGVANRKLSFKQAPNGTVLIGGGYYGKLNRITRETWVDFDKLKISAQTAIDLFPHMSKVPIVRSWAGIEGMMPDNLPIIGKSQVASGIYHSFGYSAHGYLLAPITGRLITELILHGEPSLSIEPFCVSRF